MARLVAIDCITRSGLEGPHEQIASVGGRNVDGTRWKLSLDEAIQAAEAGRFRFYTSRAGMVDIIVCSHGDHKYLRTDPAKTAENMLIYLNECVSGEFSAPKVTGAVF
jgi:hypothetical protein